MKRRRPGRGGQFSPAQLFLVAASMLLIFCGIILLVLAQGGARPFELAGLTIPVEVFGVASLCLGAVAFFRAGQRSKGKRKISLGPEGDYDLGDEIRPKSGRGKKDEDDEEADDD